MCPSGPHAFAHDRPSPTAVIPNFPFFFCAWRAWSHYRAFKASQYLQSFIQHGAILPQASSELDTIYAEHAPVPPGSEAPKASLPDSLHPSQAEKVASDADASETSDAGMTSNSSYEGGATGTCRPHLLLTRAAVPALEKFLGLPPGGTFESDLYRALEQARLRLERDGK